MTLASLLDDVEWIFHKPLVDGNVLYQQCFEDWNIRYPKQAGNTDAFFTLLIRKHKGMHKGGKSSALTREQEFIANAGKFEPMFCGEYGKKKRTRINEDRKRDLLYRCLYCKQPKTFYAAKKKKLTRMYQSIF